MALFETDTILTFSRLNYVILPSNGRQGDKHVSNIRARYEPQKMMLQYLTLSYQGYAETIPGGKTGDWISGMEVVLNRDLKYEMITLQKVFPRQTELHTFVQILYYITYNIIITQPYSNAS